MNWRARLRRPTGQLKLMAVTLGLAACLSGFLATQNAFFEGFIRELPAEPSADTLRLVEQLDAQGADAAPAMRISVDASQREALYDLWLLAEADARPGAGTLRELGDTDWLCPRVARTLVVGNLEQRLAAIDLVEAAAPTGCETELRTALDRHRRMHHDEVAAALAALVDP